MRQHMTLKISLSSKLFLAYSTTKWRIGFMRQHMRQHMTLEDMFINKLFLAYITSKWTYYYKENK